MADAEFDRDLARLRDEYLPRLLGFLDDLGARLHEARRAPARDAREGLEAARELAHRLKGTSGSYGLSECSRALGRVESALEGVLDGPDVFLGQPPAEVRGALRDGFPSVAPQAPWQLVRADFAVDGCNERFFV